jgi:hypothetical protein
MDPKKDKDDAIRKEARELADLIDSMPQDNTPKTKGKRAEDSSWRTHEECAGETYEPETSYYAGEQAKKEVTDPAEYSRDFREYCDEPTHEKGGQSVWKKEREDKLVDALYDWERKQGESEK